MVTAMKMEWSSRDLISKQIYTCVSTLFFLISQKTNLHVQHTFFQISRKKIACATRFFFAVVLHD